MSMWRHFFYVLVISFLLLPLIYAQDNVNTSQLIDHFGKATGEERSARFDSFLIQLQNNPEAIGYVFVFCGKSCRYGEIESHFRGIELKIANRFPREKIIVQHGGYRDYQEVELWLKPKNACPPTPRSTRNVKHVTFLKAVRQTLEPYDCCDDIGVQGKAFKPR